MENTLSTVLMLMISCDNVDIHNYKTKEKCLKGPSDEMKEIAMIFSTYTVISENTMVIHIFNTSITTTTVMYS